jgi:ferredoxin, 2Fe-2S
MSVRVRVEGRRRAHAWRVEPGDDLLEVLQAHGEPVATACGGVASCGLCRVTVTAGHAALGPIKAREREQLGDDAERLGLRLACQARVVADGHFEAEIVVRVERPPAMPEDTEIGPAGKGGKGGARAS